MKPIPDVVLASGPDGTAWYGGAVDRSTVSLRIDAEPSELGMVSDLLGSHSDTCPKGWRLRAPEALSHDVALQIGWILDQLTSDLDKWRAVTSRWKVDLFCGLFLDRSNRGFGLDAAILGRLAERNISVGFDIYAPDENRA